MILMIQALNAKVVTCHILIEVVYSTIIVIFIVSMVTQLKLKQRIAFCL